ncbi:MAG: metallophosphoesterase [Candidatus Cloacimonadales bacterium]|nr:metallophosphoesterase [Candidatus Cloacimonadales bacterium]
MIKTLFISDLHGSIRKYEFLFKKIRSELPAAVFIGGDLLGLAGFDNSSHLPSPHYFFRDYLTVELEKLQAELKDRYPAIFVILGNDDPKSQETELIKMTESGLITYANEKKIQFHDYTVVGYSCVSPTPFLNKDWEKYDVSRFTDVGCVSPEEGYRSVSVDVDELRYHTIKRDLQTMFTNLDMTKTICLFHSPPYQTNLDRAALDGKFVDHVPLDVHVGSIAIKEFIRAKSPYITLHGHIHESTRLTGSWMEKIGKTISFQGASERKDLAIIKIDLENPGKAEMLTS